MNWPSLSVIIPSYNQGPYIERTLLSILKQGYPGPVEVIVSDGGSTDETVEVLRKYPQVRWWSEKDRGFADAVNKGLAAATGEVVAIQSSDDFYLPGAFRTAIAALTADDTLAFVTGNDVHVGEGGHAIFHPAKPHVTMLGPGALIARDLVLYIPQHCTFIRRSAVDRVGGLREGVDYCADFDLWYRVLHFGRGLMLPAYLAAYQVHPTQRTQNKADLFIQVHKQVVEDAEADPFYAARFVPPPQMKRERFRQWEVAWNVVAGGEEGDRVARALAKDTMQHPDRWSDYVLDTVRHLADDPPPPAPPPSRVKRLAHSARLALQYNTLIRAVVGKPPYPRYAVAPNGDVLDLEWWQGRRFPFAKAAALPLTALLLGAMVRWRVKNVKTNPSRVADPSSDAKHWPSVSVIIPSYNQGVYIERTLLSILKQDYPGALEVIVSDGGSTDGTVAVLKRYPQVRWWSGKDRGFVDAVNKGLAAATGEVVAIQSSDDFYLPGAFRTAIAALTADDTLAFVTGNDFLLDEGNRPVAPPLKPRRVMPDPGALIGGTPNDHIPQHCTFVRRSIVDRVGGLREDVDLCADFDLWYRVLHFGRGLMLPDYLAAYQVHPTQRTRNNAALWVDALQKVVTDAETDPLYAARYVPTPETKRNMFRQWDIYWYCLAGGEEGGRKARALARETLEQPDQWPDYLQDYIREYADALPIPALPIPAPPSRVRGLAETLRRALQYNTLIRALVGKPPYPRYAVGHDNAVYDMAWWRDEAPAPTGTGAR